VRGPFVVQVVFITQFLQSLYEGHRFCALFGGHMARTGIAPSDTVKAYIALRKQNREPTLVNLRLELGRGSYSTLQKHLRMLAFRRKDDSQTGAEPSQGLNQQ
jgi:hypothetical protein